jgi:hypothetical protein
MEWTVARCDRPSTSSTRAAQGCAQWTHGGDAIDCSGGVMEPLTWCAASQGDAVAADPSACSPSLPALRWTLLFRRYRSSARRHPCHGHIDCALYSAIPHARRNGFAF